MLNAESNPSAECDRAVSLIDGWQRQMPIERTDKMLWVGQAVSGQDYQDYQVFPPHFENVDLCGVAAQRRKGEG